MSELQSAPISTATTIDRRSVMKGAAWSLPVIAMAIAAPSAAASTATNVGDFQTQGSCGLLGIGGRGFTLTASATAPLPIGTTVTIVGNGTLSVSLFTLSGGTAEIALLGSNSVSITLTAALPAGATLQIRSLVTVALGYQLTATTTLPTGYTAGANAKTSGFVRNLVCQAG